MTSSQLLAPPASLQLPRVSNGPGYATSSGQEAVELAAAAGLVLDPWQAYALDRMLGERADGKWAAFEVGLLVARQNGKGGILEARELAGLFLLGERLILHSAHEFKTAQEAFLRVKSLFDNNDGLRKRVAKMRTSHGEEGIELKGGARLRFIARSRSSGRGFSADLAILDEAQELPSATMGALLPVMSARPNPQVIYTGTVPGPLDNGEHFASVRDRGRRGDDPGLAWLEWSPGETWDDLDDRAAWTAANPALGYRLTEESIARERNSLDEAQFGRERLSLWSSTGASAVIDAGLWGMLADPESAPEGEVAFALDVDPDRTRTSIGVAGRRADGQAHVEIVENLPGTGWVAYRVADLVQRHPTCAVVVDGAGPAASLIPALEERGVTVVTTQAREMAAACGAFYDAAVEQELRHIDQAPLNAALGAARKRNLAEAWAWHRRDTSADITPLVAVTLALYGHATHSGQEAPPDLW